MLMYDFAINLTYKNKLVNPSKIKLNEVKVCIIYSLLFQ